MNKRVTSAVKEKHEKYRWTRAERLEKYLDVFPTPSNPCPALFLFLRLEHNRYLLSRLALDGDLVEAVILGVGPNDLSRRGHHLKAPASLTPIIPPLFPYTVARLRELIAAGGASTPQNCSLPGMSRLGRDLAPYTGEPIPATPKTKRSVGQGTPAFPGTSNTAPANRT